MTKQPSISAYLGIRALAKQKNCNSMNYIGLYIRKQRVKSRKSSVVVRELIIKLV